jgi:thimet oligopeptidase
MNRRSAGAWVVAVALLGAVHGVARAQATYAFPRYERAAQINTACDGLLSDARSRQQRLHAVAPAALLSELDAMQQHEDDVLGPMGVLSAVHPGKPLRDAAEACSLRYQAFSARFRQDQALYRQLKALQPKHDIDRNALKDRVDAMEDAGVALTAADRKKVRDIDRRIAALSQSFDRRIREDATRVAFTREQLDGVPESVWAQAPRDPQKRFQLALGESTYLSVMENANDPSTRERTWRAMQNVGGYANLHALAQLTRLRHEEARLFGQPSYAEFVLRRRMAGSEAGVQSFLADVQQAVSARERSDLDTLRAAKATHTQQPDATLNRWDVAYYLERVKRERHQVDAEQFRAYFPAKASLPFLFHLAERLFGVRFETGTQSLWHTEAQTHAVFDAASGAYLGQLFTDLYPRDDKYKHAAVWGFRPGATWNGRPGAAALVANVSRDGLTLGDLETLLHEFGHAMHALLSQTRYASQGGLGSLLDFVEAPSQMLEEWVYDPRVLALMQHGCADCKPVPDALLAQADHARHFGKGVMFARQHLYASYDLALHGRTPQDPMAVWSHMEAATPLGHVAGTIYPAGFEHIAGGYAAGYYSYLWSLAVADDLRTAFESDKLDAAVGNRYRNEVLAVGAQIPPAQAVRNFLGRDANREAFFRSLDRH